VIEEAVKNALEHADWTQLRPFRYKHTTADDGYFWKPVYICLPREVWKQVQEKIKNTEVTIDDAVNFALLVSRKYLLIKMKKEVIDASWDTDRLADVIESLTNAQKKYEYTDKIVLDHCLVCGHHEMAIFTNENTDTEESRIPAAYCYACGYRGSIWKLLEKVRDEKLPELVDKVWQILEEGEDIDDKVGAEKRQSKKKETHTEDAEKPNIQEIEKILEEARNNTNFYMQKLGFTKAELEELEIYYRSEKVLKNAKEANDFRFRVVYVVRDKDGNIAGLQGRSIWDDDEVRRQKIEQDEYWSKKPAYIREKISPKIINTKNFRKSDHLYPLWKYTENPSQYRKIVLVEGYKDAARLYCRHFPGVAALATSGCDLSDTQIHLIEQIFGKSVEIVLAFDCDAAGAVGNIRAWKKLKDAGFTKVRFAMYTEKKAGQGKRWNDFGEMFAPRQKNPGYYDKLTREMETIISRVIASPWLYLQEMKKAGIEIEDTWALEIVRATQKEEAEKFRDEANAVYTQKEQKQTKAEYTEEYTETTRQQIAFKSDQQQQQWDKIEKEAEELPETIRTTYIRLRRMGIRQEDSRKMAEKQLKKQEQKKEEEAQNNTNNTEKEKMMIRQLLIKKILKKLREEIDPKTRQDLSKYLWFLQQGMLPLDADLKMWGIGVGVRHISLHEIEKIAI